MRAFLPQLIIPVLLIRPLVKRQLVKDMPRSLLSVGVNNAPRRIRLEIPDFLRQIAGGSHQMQMIFHDDVSVQHQALAFLQEAQGLKQNLNHGR